MSNNANLEDDEIDLGELLAVLWSHKLLIALFTGLSIFLAGYNVLTTKKKFTASAIFQINQSSSGPTLNISGELGALASLAGFSTANPTSGSEALLERATGREFIIDMQEKFAFDRDPYFNSYDPDYNDPFWKSTVKKLIGWEKTDFEKKAIIEKNIIRSYRANVVFEQTDSGSISISVTHDDPQKASEYANNFMEEIRILVEDESTTAQELRLNYLSETLADALQEMEEAQENLKNYALKNSTMARQNFISDSLKLDEIRMEKRKVEEIADLLFLIEGLIKSENLDERSYEKLRSSHPLVDDIDFRRILGMSETISAWVWPEIESIDAVSTTLRDRIKRLEVEIKNIEENATVYASSAEDLARFTRDAKIAEATYTVLIEQVKSQSLAAGFQPETFKVFEFATPPLSPSSPKRNLIVTVGAVLGILIGCAISVINGLRRGVYYTKSALIADASADLALKSKSINRLSRKSISQIIASISKRRIVELDETTLKIANKNIVYVVCSGGQPSSYNTARLLAVNSAQSGRKVIICDTTGQSKKEIEDNSTNNSPDLLTTSIGNNIDVMKGAIEATFFMSKDFNAKIKDLTDRFDQVFICSSNRNGYTGLIALSEFEMGLVMISGLRRTKKFDIKNIQSKQPTDILFYG
jgi:uncharacterized protein involved in exopolysaccharide biosynthesis